MLRLSTPRRIAVSQSSPRLLIAASGTGGHLFPALAVAEQLPDAGIEWLGVPNRLEKNLVPERYPLHFVDIEGFQQPLGIKTISIVGRFVRSITQVRQLITQHQIEAVFTTGGYIAAPAILAARWQGIPAILHESNAIPGKVTRWFGPLCHTVAVGFEETSRWLPRCRTAWVSTPVRSSFRTPQGLDDLPIPPSAPLVAVIGGSQGAVAVNQMVRQCAPAWFAAGVYVVHLTGNRDRDADRLEHPQYFPLPFYDNMAGLLQRCHLVISRAGAGTLTELAVTGTPAILIPYPYAAENHQAKNAEIFAQAGAAITFSQAELTPERLEQTVLELVRSPQRLQAMQENASKLAVANSAERLAQMVRDAIA